jgi:hypothetical protein
MLLLDPIQALSERAEEAFGVAAVFVVLSIDHNQALRLTSCREECARDLWRDVFVGRGGNYK